MKRAVITLGAVLVASAAGGCFNKNLEIRSDPPGAKIFIDGYYSGIAPMSTNLFRGWSYNFMPRKYVIEAQPTETCPGYPQKMTVNTRPGGGGSVVLFEMNRTPEQAAKGAQETDWE